MKAIISWFEIPVKDMERAREFYETVLDIEIQVMEFADALMGFFPFEGYVNSGALILQPEMTPSETGIAIYFQCDDLSPMLSRVVTAGGQICIPKTQIAENMGYFAWIADTEGNRVGLYSDR